MNKQQKAQFERIKSLALANGAENTDELDEQLILSMKHLCNLTEEEAQLAEDKNTLEEMLAKIEELEAKNKAETSRIVGIILDNDALKKKLSAAEAEIAQLKSQDTFNSLVKAKLEKGLEDDELEVFEQIKSKAQVATNTWQVKNG